MGYKMRVTFTLGLLMSFGEARFYKLRNIEV